MATRQDVAKLAGTSPSVVSYVLNNGPRTVAPATRERVLAAVRELDYRPNKVARSLRLNQTMTLGLVVPDSANPFFAELAKTVEDQAWSSGYTLLVGNSADDPERELEYIRTFIDCRVDGILLIPSHNEQPWRSDLTRSRIPSLVFDRELESVPISHVLVDNVRGAKDATEHLLGHGRRRIGCIAGPLGIHPTVDRVVGWRLALENAGFKAGSGSGGRTGWETRPEAAPLLHGSFGRLDGYRSGHALLTRDRSVDALFVTSDEQAAGVLRAASELRIRVPRDLAVVSFDGIAASEYTTPVLATMRQPVEQLGRTAMERLLQRMQDPDLPPSRDVLQATLVARGSCGCPDPPGSEHPPADSSLTFTIGVPER
ncbi:LacI family DNA-binding transcriptional regulator [Streptomyces sp. NPDC004752]